MNSVVCPGLKSCLEPRLTEPTVLTPKMPSKSTQFQQKPNNNETVNKNNMFGFFNVLENQSSTHVKHEEVYVHPMVKRSASTLSTRSLEMCTESLGTETGSDVSESSDEVNKEEKERFSGLRRSKTQIFDRKILSHSRGGCSFPPPLTSISGSDGTVKVRPHREGGRLVIKAVSVSDCGTKFETERANGRLSLCLLRDCYENVETRRAKLKNECGEELQEWCDVDVKEGSDGKKMSSKTKIRSPMRKSRLPNSSVKSTEFALTKCKDGRNGNKGMGNWSLIRVVIS
ncbi:protein FANTASTIC FOUR 2-like [Bidens hawaiensis]|uniref:protein FANTASTIC FOUR 2-like n=1 Tax=Bidens hawaiensis TaxID=980011 RepID=UPI00404964BD